MLGTVIVLTLLHSEQPKFSGVLAILSAIGAKGENFFDIQFPSLDESLEKWRLLLTLLLSERPKLYTIMVFLSE